MGKSPGKWIRTLLFRKKVSGSGATRGREPLKAKNEKDVWVTGKEPPSEVAVDHPFISMPVAANANRNEETSALEKGLASSVASGGDSLPTNHPAESQVTIGYESSNALEKFKEEQAAIKAQAAFRGYLARRAFRALKGIIRLQALIRGHLVRRQAVATLRCLQGIVKLQALVRGRRVRRSDTGTEIRKTCPQEKTLGDRPLGVRKSFHVDKVFANALVSKILSPSPTGMPLSLWYGDGEPNSAYMWLERWTYILFLKPRAQHERGVGSKGETKLGTLQTVETETGRSKRSVRKIPILTDSGSFEKPKRNLRKPSSHPVDSVQEHPQNELEKVKRSLRKVTNSAIDGHDQHDAEAEKPKRNLKKVVSSQSEVPDQRILNAVEDMKNDTMAAPAGNLEVGSSLKREATDGPALLHCDHPAVELPPLEISGKDESIVSVVNGELSSKEDKVSHENHKSRRASFPEKSEYSENGLQKTPTVPSYMAKTESSKAKLRGQGSPRFGQDGAEKNGSTRRHSLPSAVTGIVSSPSVRAQKLVQSSGKGGIRSDRPLSSRDGNDKAIQVEWRR
ncbi:hypothetical protein AAC387_Pa02g1482 [Persea americana]